MTDDADGSGEVLVRERDTVTAIATDRLDEDIAVDLDHTEAPHIGVPADSWVSYEGGPGFETNGDGNEEVATDGGLVSQRVEMRQYGLGLSGDLRDVALSLMALVFSAAGYLWSAGESVAAIVAMAAGAFLVWVLMRHRGDAGE